MNRRFAFLLALLFPFALAGCPTGGNLGGDDDDSATGDDDDATPPPDDDDATGDDDDDATADDDDATGDDDDATPPEVTIAETFPADAATGIFVGEGLWVEFSGETEADITLATAAGDAHEGNQVWISPTRLALDPTGPLLHSTDYVATVTWGAAGSQTFGFTTSDEGSVPFEQDLVGNTYAFDINSGTILSPQGGEQFLDQLNSALLMTVTAQTDTTIGFRGALALADSDPPEQDFCAETVEFDDPPPIWADPTFQAGPADVPQSFDIPNVGPVDLTFRQMEVSGTFASTNATDVDQIIGGSVYTVVDIRDAGLGIPCAQIGLFVPGIVCQSCPHEPAVDECVIIWATGLTADIVPDLSLLEWAEADFDPTCG